MFLILTKTQSRQSCLSLTARRIRTIEPTVVNSIDTIVIASVRAKLAIIRTVSLGFFRLERRRQRAISTTGNSEHSLRVRGERDKPQTRQQNCQNTKSFYQSDFVFHIFIFLTYLVCQKLPVPFQAEVCLLIRRKSHLYRWQR
jgi:hypothetical protein